MADRWTQEGCPTSVLDMVPGGVGKAAGAPGAAPSGVPLTKEGLVSRVLALSGPLSQYGRPAILEPYDEIFRVEPNDSWFDPIRSPSNPTQFEIGSISAERGKWIFIFDYSVRPFGFSGVAAGDVRPMPEGQLSGSFGYVIRNAGNPVGVTKYRLNPTSPNLRRQRFKFNQSKIKPLSDLTTDDFARSQANSFASASGYGGEVHPQAPERFGATNVPFMISVGDDLPLEVTGIVYNEISTPVAFVEVRLSGYITSATVARKLLSDLEQTTR